MIIVFTGPTITASEAARHLDATYLGPVSQGDLLCATRQKPWAIGIIDGFFERIPAVTHKEILWAMSQGIHVLGAASMGALRAAELSVFGMVGVGNIFQAYASGELQDDDEVAIAHGPVELEYRPGSEAMVNIRATFARASAADMLSSGEAARLTDAAKSLFYPLRSYPAILDRAASDGAISLAKATALRQWLKHNRVDQKRADAIDLLSTLAQSFAREPERKRVTYTFSHTEIWDHTMRHSRPVLQGLEPVEQRPLTGPA